MSHTPGPWIKTRHKYDAISDSLDNEIIYADHDGNLCFCNDADEQLTISAPDLLAACEQLLRAQDGVEVGDAYCAIHAAIAKAKGKA